MDEVSWFRRLVVKGGKRLGRRARAVTSGGLAPALVAGGISLPSAAMSVIATAALATAAVTAAPAIAAKAATTGNGKALVLLQNGGTPAPETTALEAAGWTVTQATPATWLTYSAATFESYAVLVIGDPSTTSSCSTLTPTTATSGNDAIGTTWQSAVSGHVAVLGTAPAAAGTSAANSLITDAVGYAGSGSGTGLYVSLNCGYKTAAANTAVPLLNGVEGIGAAGGLTVQGSLSCSDPGTVNKWEADTAGTFTGFTSSSLGTSSWPSPGCPVQEAFSSWPAMFTPVAYDAASDVTANFTASDGVSGQPYVLLGQPLSVTAAATAGTETTGGVDADALMVHAAGNPATPGLVHATAGTGVDTENGDFSQSSTDFSIPGFGPALDFTRTYDANLARQEQVPGTPGSMGYGWTDNWATSEIHYRPFPGYIYQVNSPGESLNGTGDIAADPAGNVFIANYDDNNVVEVAASSHSQFGIAMTAGDAYVVAGSASGASGYSGDGGLATSALLNYPDSVAVDGAGDLFIADTDNNRIQEVPATSGTQLGISMTADKMYTIAGSASGASGASGDGGKATLALLNYPGTVRTDSQGNVYITDEFNYRVQEVAASTGSQRGVAMTDGYMYTIAGSASGTNYGDSGDTGPATAATFEVPVGLALDASGDVYVTDGYEDVVREIAGTTRTQWGQSMTANDIYTVAGTPSVAGTGGISGDGAPARSADLNVPQGVAVDSSGDIYIADTSNNRIQEVPAASGTQWGQSMTAGDMYTVAGTPTGVPGYTGNGGPPASAEMDAPDNLATDAYGDLLIADTGNGEIREVFDSTNQLFSTTPQGTGNTFVLADGSRVDFQAKLSSGACPTGYELYPGSAACTLPVNVGAGLQQNPSTHDYVYKLPSVSYTYAPNGGLLSVADRDGNTLTVTAGTPSPGSGNCPSSAASCQTITAAVGTGGTARSLVIGSNSAGLVTSVTDPMGRRWAYAYNSADQLTSATDPLGNVTSYTYGAGTTGNPQLASDLLTITSPNAQPGGPDAGKETVNLYDSQGRVTSQTDPMGYATTFSYCANSTASGCMDAATGTGFTRVSVPDGNSTVYAYTQGAESARSTFTGTTLTSETDMQPDTTTGTLLNTSSTDGDNNTTTNIVDPLGNTTVTVAPAATGTATTTTGYAESVFQTEELQDCATTAQAAAQCSTDSPPAPVAAGGVITPPSSAPPVGTMYILYDTDENELYSTTGVYEPGATTAAYSRTTYTLYNGNSVTLPGTTSAVTCTGTAPSQSLPCAKINADSVVTQLAYDSAGDLVSSSTPDGNGSEIATTKNTYNADGEQTSTTSPDGNLSGANAGNYTTVTAYNADGEQTTVTQADGAGATVTPRVTTYGYDGDGNQATIKDARGYTTTTTYNADDQATLVTNPDGDSTLTCYDSDGNTAQTVPAVGVAANSLTASSCPASYPAGYGDRLAADATTDTYDANGDKTAETTPAPAGQSGDETTTYTYDPAGNLVTTTAPPSSDSSGAPSDVTVDTYNNDNELSSETTGYGTPAASETVHCYDANGDKTAVIPGDADASPATCGSSSPYETTYAYDSAGEMVSQTTPATTADPSGGTTTYTYGPAGNQLTSTDPSGVTATYAYDPAGVRVSVTYSGSAAYGVAYSYDANGNKTAMTDATGTSSYAYDPFGDLTSTTNGSGQTTSYGYDSDGNATGITYPLPAAATWATTDTVSYGYDNADQLTSVSDFTGKAIDVTHDADGATTKETLGSSGDTVTTAYDSTGAVSSVTLESSSGTVLQSFTYSDAPDGTILSETDAPATAGTSKTYTYNASDEVTSDSSGSPGNYGYDASGNLTTLPTGATSTYDHAGELASATLGSATTAYTYNADGERTGAAVGGTTTETATWNGTAELTGYSDSGGPMTTAAYDGDGMRASATFTPAGSSTVTESYLWDGDNLLTDSSSAYIYGTGTAPAEQVNLATGTVTYLVTDSLGSVRGTVNSSGALTGTTSYDAWGNPLTSGGLTAATPFGYAGGYTDPDGLIYLINRYYDPATGQFISIDPDLNETQQPYAYAAGDPVNAADPTGDMGCDPAVNCKPEYPYGYSYTYTWNIGPVSRLQPGVGHSAQDVMTLLEGAPQVVYPFYESCQVLYVPENCYLHVTIGPSWLTHADTWVRVIYPSSASYKFTVTSTGYFDARGSNITFSMSIKNGNVYLSQHGIAKGPDLASQYAFHLGYVKHTWNTMASRLSHFLGI